MKPIKKLFFVIFLTEILIHKQSTAETLILNESIITAQIKSGILVSPNKKYIAHIYAGVGESRHLYITDIEGKNIRKVVNSNRIVHLKENPEKITEEWWKNLSENPNSPIISEEEIEREKGINPINPDDINGIVWLPNSSVLIYAVSPIYGKPGIYLYEVEKDRVKRIVSPKNYSTGYPDGNDYFELIGISEDGKKIYFYYFYDINKIDDINIDLYTPENIYSVNIDGSNMIPLIRKRKDKQ